MTAPGSEPNLASASVVAEPATQPYVGKDFADFLGPWREDVAGAIRFSVFRGEGRVDAVEVRPEFRRQGVASALYRKMLDITGLSLEDVPASSLTEDGEKFREAIERKT